MDTQANISYWLQSAAHDMQAAEALFAAEKYDWCLFIGHLVIEKTIKSFYVREQEALPPKTHNLALLAEHTKLPLTADQKKFLLELNRFNIEARYPDYKHSFYKLCTQDFTREYFDKIKEFHEWLLSRMPQ